MNGRWEAGKRYLFLESEELSFLPFGLCGDLEGSLAACLFREKMPKPLVPYLERLCGRIHVKLKKS